MTPRLLAAVWLVLVAPVIALDGDPRMHDPSTVVLHDGRFYTYGTGNGLPISVSDDGWTWRRAGSVMAPSTDVSYELTGRALAGMPLLG